MDFMSSAKTLSGRNSLLFPDRADQFPVPQNQIPCSGLNRVFTSNALECLRQLAVARAKTVQKGRKSCDFPDIFPVLREIALRRSVALDGLMPLV
jgi:hypothetical protein